MATRLKTPRDGVRHGFISGVTDLGQSQVNRLVNSASRGYTRSYVTSVTFVTGDTKRAPLTPKQFVTSVTEAFCAD